MTSLISYYYSNAKTSGRVQEGSKCSNRSKFLAGVLFYGPSPNSVATVQSNNFEKVNGEKKHPKVGGSLKKQQKITPPPFIRQERVVQ